ncbi:hypothetical protein T11_3594 [Trichinella zimbabwensis]|uniref:Uncharacterized protein n=1 Tax=Trichinella zimbabwensis TaxID=268475 RepID=A0A0V1G7A9_9BILA|nr:hypothetical protein T11_3594 [Trichinella zimbabwensis]
MLSEHNRFLFKNTSGISHQADIFLLINNSVAY